MGRKIILLTGGLLETPSAKTAANLIRYRPEEVVAVLDPDYAGQSCQSVLGFGGSIPVVATLGQVPEADTMVVGIAPPGGRLPMEMRAVLLQGIDRNMNVVSGLHDFLARDPEIAQAARLKGVQIVDLRSNSEKDVANRRGLDERCLRILTVGQDCNVGKMVVSLELTRALQRAGQDAKFAATGQTGILIEGDGCPVDAVVVDFINGAAEKLVLAHQRPYRVLLIEGQGSIAHPRYSAVTLGLLHGCVPDGLILCYEMGRTTVYGMDHVALPSLNVLIGLYETMANVMHPCRVIGVAMNSRRYPGDQAKGEQEQLRRELGLPVCDVVRHGPAELVQAILAFQKELGKCGTGECPMRE